MVDICLLGTGGGMPMPGNFLSSAILSYCGRKILIDCGEGTQVSMKMNNTGFKAIDIICITHFHGDHTVGIPGLLSTIGNSGRQEPITIIGPSGIKDVIKGLNVINPILPYDINIIEDPKQVFLKVSTNKIKLVECEKEANVVLSTLELEHSAPCIGYSFYYKRKPKFNINKALKNEVPKFLWNKLQKGETVRIKDVIYKPDMILGKERKGLKLSYITDTRPIKEIKDFIKYSDLFICEGTYGKNEDIDKAIKNKHMTFKESAMLAMESKVDDLILTHFSVAIKDKEQYIQNATDIFKNTILGEDGMKINLKFKD